MSLEPARSAILNHQRRVPISARAYQTFIQKVECELRLAQARFDVALVDDCESERLNLLFRKRAAPADVLSFSWVDGAEAGVLPARVVREFAGFLGDIVISVEAASRNAKREKHSVGTEVRQLILHGVLHLLGYDHEVDEGEMNRLELKLRRRLAIEGKREEVDHQPTEFRGGNPAKSAH